jgi:hypothetical protein
MKLIPYVVCVAIVGFIGTNVIQTAQATVNTYQEQMLERCERMNQILPGSCEELSATN